jgi:metal-sulfur cluster biosynthetic enzyme
MDDDTLKQKSIEALKSVYDPELPVNLYDMGLFYKIEFARSSQGRVTCAIDMTLTSPACSVSDLLVERVYGVLTQIKEIDEVYVQLVFDPPWDPMMMSEDAQLQMSMM